MSDRYLVDTNVLSEARKGARADRGVRAFRDGTSAEALFVSVLTLGEIRRGVERLRSRDPVTAGALDRWLARIEREFASRVVAVDAGVADTWGRLDARSLPVIDGLLAATALTHDLVLVTRNVRDVKGTGVRVLDPFGAA